MKLSGKRMLIWLFFCKNMENVNSYVNTIILYKNYEK